MPWALLLRPSIQLGTLKAYLESSSSETIQVDCHHPFIEVAQLLGTNTYRYISDKSWAAEAVYASLLHPKKQHEHKKLFTSHCKNNKAIAQNFEKYREIVESQLTNWIKNSDLYRYRLIGFTVCFAQLSASLLAAERIKQFHKEIDIVFGGSLCVNSTIPLTEIYPQVDYVITGEGERPLLKLCNHLIKNEAPSLQSIVTPAQVKELDSLPCPDYTNYFKELEQFFPSIPFIPTVPVEFSRGCWWNKCSFCNLNQQWKGYRSKTSKKVIAEIKTLIKRHNSLDFTFCDNALPKQEAHLFF